jgi:putative DNA primase/helicase
LAVQPDVLGGLMEKPGFRGRGLLARFLFSLPTSRVGFRELNPPSIPVQVSAGYAKLVRTALQLQPAVDAKGNPCPHVVRVSAEAFAELTRFRAWTERALRIDGELSALRDWGNKLPGAVCRIAGIFHGLMHAATGNPAGQPIDRETILCAIAIGEYAVGHAIAAFCEMGANPATATARRILAWATEGRRTDFSRRDAFNAVRGVVQRVDELDEPLQLLIEHGYIRERSIERGGPGRKPSARYDVNPLAYTQNTHNSQNSGPAGDSAHCA